MFIEITVIVSRYWR